MTTGFGLRLLTVLLVGACATQPKLYEWGDYEGQLYAAYSEPGKVPVESQVSDLEENLQKAQAAGRPVPPGYLAHLGYLHVGLGDKGKALRYFEQERSTYPESKKYMDRLIQQLKK